MKEKRKYTIELLGLENKTHEYEFKGSPLFFEELGSTLIQEGSFQARVLLHKSETMLQLEMHIKAFISLVCDRSLELFEDEFDIQERYIYKFGEKAEVMSDELEVIPVGTQNINIAEHLYDFIHLAIPMKKLHPRFRNPEAPEYELIYTDVVEEKEEEKSIDPRWEALRKLNNN